MGDFKITRKGRAFLAALTLLAIVSLIKGSIFLAVFSFVFFSVILLITLYEVFINR